VLEAASSIEELSGEPPRNWHAATRELARIGVRVLVPSDAEYPRELATIDAAPLLLYVRGGALDRMRPAVAIVGARACTSGAARFAERLGEMFASCGFTVVSGLARGIDGAAHRGAVEAGRTIAVLGTGHGVCYPSEHRNLSERIAERGALVSEFPPAIGPRAWHFPARNRIISGLSAAVVVVEAGAASGALITASFALDHGRHVLACTTGPENPAGAGVRDMLRDGATLVVDAEQAVEVVTDLLSEQGFAFGKPLPRPAERAVDLTGELRRIYDAITEDCTVDEIVSASLLEPARVASGLAGLELEGLVVTDRGRWRRR
jgi:DNA processing protein